VQSRAFRVLAAVSLIVLGVVLIAFLRRPVPTPVTDGGVAISGPAGAASAPRSGGVDGHGDASARRPSALVRGPWGTRPGEFGRKRDAESAPEAPMSLVVSRSGELHVLDQENGRVQRFGRDGKWLGQTRIGGDTVQDLALDREGNLLTLDRLAKGEVAVYGPGGQLRATLPLVGGPIEEGGAVTGLFSDATGTYVEREHNELVRIAGPDGKPDPARPTQPGRPSRDGKYYLWARLANARAGTVTLRVFDRDARLVWQRAAQLPGAVAHLLLLDSDREGHLYLGALVGRMPESGDLEAPSVAVLRLDLARGGEAGLLALPASEAPEEMFRELTVSDGGEIFQLLPGADGLEIHRYTFP